MYTVMIVDDEYIIKRSLAKMIHDHHKGFTVAGEAENGKEALAQIERVRPDVLITDICMPVMDGLALIQSVRDKHLFLEPIIISGYGEFAYAQKALQYGVNDYILKPIRPEALYKTLDRTFHKLEYRRRHFARHSEWLVFCREAAQKLVDRLLLLNEKSLAAELQSAHQSILCFEPELSPYPLRSMYQDFITACNTLLKETLYCPGVTLSPAGAASKSPEQLYKEVWTSLLDVIEELREKKNLKANYKIQKAIDVINERFTEALSLEDVAQEVGLTPAYFSSAFSDSVGVSFVQYVTQLRMNRAKTLLKNTKLKTYDIAEAVGYYNYPHFSRMFKKYVGSSPEMFRKLP